MQSVSKEFTLLNATHLESNSPSSKLIGRGYLDEEVRRMNDIIKIMMMIIGRDYLNDELQLTMNFSERWESDKFR